MPRWTSSCEWCWSRNLTLTDNGMKFVENGNPPLYDWNMCWSSDRKKKVCGSEPGSNEEDQQVLQLFLLRHDSGPGLPFRTCSNNMDQVFCRPSTAIIKGYNMWPSFSCCIQKPIEKVKYPIVKGCLCVEQAAEGKQGYTTDLWQAVDSGRYRPGGHQLFCKVSSHVSHCSPSRMLWSFQAETSLSSRECLTSVKTMISLRWGSWYTSACIVSKKKLILSK